MKILFVHDHIFRINKEEKIYTKGGLPKEIWNRYLLDNKTEILVIARSKKVDKINGLKETERDRVKFLFLNEINKIKNKFIPSAELRLKIETEVKSSDLIIVRLPSELGNLAYDIGKKYKKKIIVEVVGCVWDSLWNYGSIKAKLYAPIAFYKMKKRVKDSRYSIYVTQKWLQEKYPTSGKLISCSNVELECVDENLLKKREEKVFGEKIKIGLIGNIGNKIKGIDIALKAMSILKNRGHKIELNILGAGNKNIWLKMIKDLKLEKDIKFDGVLPSGDPVLKWLDELDIYIQPSYQEGLPRSVIEAMSRGLPIITSDAGGCKELISLELIHRKGNYIELANRVEKLISNNSLKKYEMKRNQEKSKEYLNVKLFKKRINFFGEIVKN